MWHIYSVVYQIKCCIVLWRNAILYFRYMQKTWLMQTDVRSSRWIIITKSCILTCLISARRTKGNLSLGKPKKSGEHTVESNMALSNTVYHLKPFIKIQTGHLKHCYIEIQASRNLVLLKAYLHVKYICVSWVYSGYSMCFIGMCVHWESNPWHWQLHETLTKIES